MTYSIVARDPSTGELGVAVQTHQPAVGAIVPWVRPGVGAIATQASSNIAFGPDGLELLSAGKSANETLAELLAADPGRETRQVAIIAAKGQPAAHTGAECIRFAGHLVAQDFTVQANIMVRDTVPAAMAAAFTAATGHLSERLLAALDAAQRKGGNLRGMQSAAMLIRDADAGSVSRPWFDLRIDNDPHPLDRLRELVNLRRAGALLNAREGDPAPSLEVLRQRLDRARTLGANDEQLFWFAISHLGVAEGGLPAAVNLLREVISRAPQWRELLARVPSPVSPGMVDAASAS